LSSFSLLINREHRLPQDYVPSEMIPVPIPFDAHPKDSKRLMQKEAALAAAQLLQRARSMKIQLYGISGYRSYERQKILYENALTRAMREHSVSREEAVPFILVSPPGASEHQSGLALDVSSPSVALDLTEDFGRTREGRWLKAYAPLYGFILRYPKDKVHITGYAWEPWHIRYVTKSLALYLSLTNLTLEEYHSI
jgi:D-alanyl-D-alanine carboxypeptidase